MSKLRFVSLAMILAVLPMRCVQASAAEELIIPECQTTLYYSVGVLDIHFDRNYNGANFSIYRSQPEGEFLYYSFDAHLIDQTVLRCKLIEGDYKLEVTVPSADTTEYICYTPIEFTIQDPDMDETQSFDSTELHFYLATDSLLSDNTLETGDQVLSDRIIHEECSFTAAHRPFKMGDLNSDDTVNAADAASVLIAASLIGAGEETGFTAMQYIEADMNGDNLVNASDAAMILQYAAEYAAGNFTGSALDFVRRTSDSY